MDEKEIFHVQLDRLPEFMAAHWLREGVGQISEA
jgi:hypothetical protein